MQYVYEPVKIDADGEIIERSFRQCATIDSAIYHAQQEYGSFAAVVSEQPYFSCRLVWRSNDAVVGGTNDV